MADALVFIDDLFFQMKILETARQLGVTAKVVTQPEALVAEARQDGPRLVIVDLNARAGGVEAVERLRAAGIGLPVVAFLSHVQVELAERARAAGCSEVMPRSKFTQQLPAILARAREQAGP
jgi:CheY-like chemotaxis protein